MRTHCDSQAPLGTTSRDQFIQEDGTPQLAQPPTRASANLWHSCAKTLAAHIHSLTKPAKGPPKVPDMDTSHAGATSKQDAVPKHASLPVSESTLSGITGWHDARVSITVSRGKAAEALKPQVRPGQSSDLLPPTSPILA